MIFIIVVIACVILNFAGTAFAYVDPNTGGYVFQLLFPIITGIVAAFAFFKNQIKKVCKRIQSYLPKSGKPS